MGVRFIYCVSEATEAAAAAAAAAASIVGGSLWHLTHSHPIYSPINQTQQPPTLPYTLLLLCPVSLFHFPDHVPTKIPSP